MITSLINIVFPSPRRWGERKIRPHVCSFMIHNVRVLLIRPVVLRCWVGKQIKINNETCLFWIASTKIKYSNTSADTGCPVDFWFLQWFVPAPAGLLHGERILSESRVCENAVKWSRVDPVPSPEGAGAGHKPQGPKLQKRLNKATIKVLYPTVLSSRPTVAQSTDISLC